MDETEALDPEDLQLIVDTDLPALITATVALLDSAEINKALSALLSAAPAQTDAINIERIRLREALSTLQGANATNAATLTSLSTAVTAVWTDAQAAADAVLNP